MSKLAANTTLVLAAVGALLTLLAAFGIGLSGPQHDAILGALSAALAVVGIYFHPDIPIGKTSPPSP
jgi:hypothetical protein